MTDTSATNRRLGWVVGLTSTAYFMVILDSVVVITALPRMQRDLHVSLSSLQWTLNAYGIAFAAGIITAAALGDRFGRRKVFTIGLALFTRRFRRLRPGAEPIRVDRRPDGARARRRGRAAAELDDPDGGFPGRASRDDRRDLRRPRRSRRRDGTDRRRRRHAGHRLALDLLDQRPDRRRRRAPRPSVATRELWRTGATRPRRSRARHRRRRRAGLGAQPRQRGWLVERRGRGHVGRGGGAARRLRPVGELGARADGAAPPVRGPGLRDRQRDHVPHVGRHLRGRAPGHGGVPARAPLLAGWRRGAPAPVLRDADVRLTPRRRSLRSDRPPTDHRRRAEHADGRVRVGRLARLRCARAGSSS